MNLARPWMTALLMIAACGGSGDGGTGETGDESASTSTSTTSTSTATATSEGSTSEGSTSAADSSSGAGTTDAGDSGSSETSAPTIPCGDGTCPLGDVCVIPCCGGAGPPPCYDPGPNLTCMGMDAVVSPGKCTMPCNNPMACCQPSACVPDPPFCVTEADLTCNGTDCNYEDCFGYFEMDFLNCTCA